MRESKFVYYVIDTFDGTARGTNEATTAAYYARSPDYFVVRAATGEWLREDGTSEQVKEIGETE